MKIIVILFLSILGCLPTFAQIPGSYATILREEITQHLNELRVSKGLNPLLGNAILRKAARCQSTYMAYHKKLSHYQGKTELSTPAKRVEYFKGLEFDLVGENVLQSKEVLIPLRKSRLRSIAKDMFLAWKNSPGHYANMINSHYALADIDFQLGEGENVIYATQVFAKKGIKIKGQLSSDAFGLVEAEEDCGDEWDSFSNVVANMGNSIAVVGTQVLFYYHNIDYFNKIFEGSRDGIAIDVLRRGQFSCDVYNQLDYSPIHDGILLEPVYKEDILKRNSAKSDYRIISSLGSIPDVLADKAISTAVILIKDGKKCKYLVPGKVPSKAYQLRAISPRINDLSNVKLMKSGILKSIELSYDFHSNAVSPVEYPKIDREKYEVHSIEIRSYSSVEGSEEGNTKLHNARAQLIKKHLLDHIEVGKAKIRIDTKENWDKMYFQLRYFFRDDLIDLSKDSLKSLLASNDNTLSWDSLLYIQRQAKAIIHYSGTVSEAASQADLITLNLRTAIAERDYALANAALAKMYQSNILLPKLLFEATVFQAIKSQPELSQNAAALFSKMYKADLHHVTEFLYACMTRKEKPSNDAIHNLLHLQTLVSDWLINTWDVPSQRLSNVIHPSIVQGLVGEDLEDELALNLHLTFIRYFGQINDGINISKSFNFIVDYFKPRTLNIEDEIDLALFFNWCSMYQMTNDYLLAKFADEKLNEDAIFLLLKTLNFYNDKGDIDAYEEVYLKALELNQERWCNWVNLEFQILRNTTIKTLFCEKCKI
ncbi:MAG: CAP domain-containing protein [Bacteroidota bacterium]